MDEALKRGMDELYKRAYMAGYTAAKEERRAVDEAPYIDKEGLIKRYNGKIGQNKAGEILRAVRRCCNGGKLDSCSIVLVSELEYWETLVDKRFKERL